MQPTKPGDHPDRPSLQYGTLHSGLNPAGKSQGATHAAHTVRPGGAMIAIGLLLAMILLPVVALMITG